MSNNMVIVSSAGNITLGDPLFNKVAVLLDMNGQPITDAKNHAVTSANIVLSSANAKFGSSAVFNGIDSWLAVTPGSDTLLGTNDFTFEWRGRIHARPASQAIIFTNAPAAGTQYADTTIGLNLMADGNVRIQSSYAVFVTGSTILPLDTDLFLSVTQANGRLYLGVNGVITDSAPNTRNFSANNQILLGKEGPNSNNFGATLNGECDEFRLTNGVGRWTSNYTVPTTAFPNH